MSHAREAMRLRESTMLERKGHVLTNQRASKQTAAVPSYPENAFPVFSTLSTCPIKTNSHSNQVGDNVTRSEKLFKSIMRSDCRLCKSRHEVYIGIWKFKYA